MIELTRNGAIAVLRICRPQKKNAFTRAMWHALHGACTQLAAEHHAASADASAGTDTSAARVLLVQGDGGVFCAGADIEEMATLVQDPAALAANNQLVSQAQTALAELPLPTIAAIDGACYGGGFGLAVACDFRIATPGSHFAITPARLGLLYSIEDTRRVLALLGPARTRRLLLRSEKLDAATALAWGAVDALATPEALAGVALHWAASLAAQSRTSMAGIKATLALLAAPDKVTAAAEQAVRSTYSAAFSGPDFSEGAAAFLQRRQPRF